MEIERAKARVRHHLVAHPRFARCVTRLERDLLTGPKRNHRHLYSLIGYTGAGKSSVVAELQRRHPSVETNFGVTLPIVHAELPSEATNRAVVAAIFEAMGYVAPYRFNRYDITREIAEKASRLETRLVVIDEAQHVMRETPRKNTDFLKTLRQKLPCDILLVGLPSLERWKFAEGQLFRRSDQTLHLKQYGLRDRWEQQQYLSFLARMEDALELPLPSNLATPDLARRMYAATDGLPGLVTKILVEALQIALELSAPNLSNAILQQAYERDNARFFVQEDDIGPECLLGAFDGVDRAIIEKSSAEQEWLEIDPATNPFVCPPKQLAVILAERRKLLRTIEFRQSRQRKVVGELEIEP